RPHANSLDATGPHDVYAIRYVGGRDDLGIKPGTVLHYGETGRGYRTRGVEWARFFREEYGFLVESVRLTTVEGKRAAREQETRRIQIFERLFGHKPGFFTPDGQFVQTQKSCH